MVHYRSFFCKLRHAFQYTDVQCSVRKDDTEEFAFEFAVFLFVLLRFLLPFLQLLAFPLSVAFPYQPVVFGFEVGRANILRAVRVLTKMTEQVYHIAPHRAVGYGVAITDADFNGCPIVPDIESTMQIMA